MSANFEQVRVGTEELTYEAVAKTIDHSLLRPELTESEVAKGCELARRYDVASVCVRLCDVSLAARALSESSVAVGTVVAFPHGSAATETKVFETRLAIEQGATEIDVVINIGLLRSCRDEAVREDLREVVTAAGEKIVKVIPETAYLTDEEKVRACRLAEKAGARFVKTSTGFAASGATIEDVMLMRASVSPGIGVKAAGGVRTLDALLGMVRAGVSRVGATSTEKILEEFVS